MKHVVDNGTAMSKDKETELLQAKLNLETARIPFKELLRYFANGSVIAVSEELDLIDVAARIAADDAETVSGWLDAQRLVRVTDAQAKAWLDIDAMVWTVVVKPWILVQHQSIASASVAGSTVH